MITIAIIAQKGGSGKTTLALTLAVAAEQVGRTPVVLDVDPQASSCRWGDRRDAATPVVLDAQPARLERAIEAARRSGFDVAIIDTPARIESAALEATRIATLVAMPCRPLMLDLETVPASQRLVTLAAETAPSLVAVISAAPPRGRRADETRAALTNAGIRVCPHLLTHRAAVADAVAVGQVAAEYAPRSPAAAEARAVTDWILEEGGRCRSART